MTKNTPIVALLVFLLCRISVAHSQELKLSSLFSDNMVSQRGLSVVRGRNQIGRGNGNTYERYHKEAALCAVCLCRETERQFGQWGEFTGISF